MPIPIIVPLLAAAAATAAASRRGRAATLPRASSRAMPWPAFTALTARWGAALGVPELLLWVIATIESHRDPALVNDSPRAAAKGNAWGLYQVTLDTARDLFQRYGKQLKKKFPTVAAKWDGAGASLLDADLNAMLGAFYLSGLWRSFKGDFVATVAAYQQGPATVRALIARGATLPDDLPPKGRQYVQLAEDARRLLTPVAAAAAAQSARRAA